MDSVCGDCYLRAQEATIVACEQSWGEWAFGLTLGLIFEDGGCMSPAECPCEFHGTLHPPGSVVTEDCNTWSVSTARREGPGKASASCQTVCLGLRNSEKTGVTHLTSLSSKGMSLDPWAGVGRRSSLPITLEMGCCKLGAGTASGH